MVNEYSRYMSEALYSVAGNGEENNKAVQCIATSNETVVSETCGIVQEHAFTLAHIQVDRAEYSDDTKLMQKVDSWCSKLWEHTPYNSFCVVLLGGVKGGANGACFINIKSPSDFKRIC